MTVMTKHSLGWSLQLTTYIGHDSKRELTLLTQTAALCSGYTHPSISLTLNISQQNNSHASGHGEIKGEIYHMLAHVDNYRVCTGPTASLICVLLYG